jgi:undecaprenyl diphosphate synthase
VALLMRLFRRYLVSEVARCVTNGVRMKIIGRRDRIPAELLRAICNAENATRDGKVLDLRIAVDYSARDAIVRAGRAIRPDIPRDSDEERAEFARLLSKVENGIGESSDVDLLIRTGGEQRLSDFLLWECAYAELYFTRRMWPEFSPKDLSEAVEEFMSRERRFGTVPAAAAG